MELVTTDFDRELNASGDDAMRVLLETLAGLGFHFDRTQGGVIEAHRGSALKAGFGGAPPVKLAASVVGRDGRARLHVHLGDAQPFPMATDAVRAIYAPVFGEVEERLDGGLRAVDASIPATKTSPVTTHAERQTAPGAMFTGLMHHLPGSMRRSTARATHQQVNLTLVAPDASVVLTADEAQTTLAVAAIVSADERALPPPLRRQVTELDVGMRGALAGAQPPGVTFELDNADKPAVEFLYQQSRLRQMLPVREVHRCRDCDLERIVNPDFQKLLAKNRKLQKVLGVGGLTVTPAALNPFTVAGRLMNLGFRPPPEACRRCEGTDIDVSIATICAQCHRVRKETVLRRCPECGYDFLSRIAGESLWARAATGPASTAASAPPTLAG